MPVLGQFPTKVHLIDTDTVKWTAGAAYQDPNFPDYAVRDTTADVVIGGVDARTSATETIGTADFTKLVTLSHATAIAVTLDSTVSNHFFAGVMNIGAGTATLTPSSGQIWFDGALVASIALVTGQTAVVYFDGTNWEAYVVTNGTLQVSQGGTGDVTLTAHAVLVGEGTSPIAEVGPGALHYPLLGQGASADPAFKQPRGNTDVAQMADSTANPTTGDLAKFDANGNVADAGVLASAVVTTGVTLTADQPVFGAGGNAVKVGTKSGNTDEVGTVSGALTSGNLLKSDASGNLIDAAIAASAVGTVTHTGGALTADQPVFGAGGADVKVGTKSGNTDEVATVSGSLTSGDLTKSDASGNIVDAGVATTTDGTLAANSDGLVPTEKAVKTYVDSAIAGDTDYYQTVQQATTSRTQRAKLNVVAPLTATDNSGNGSTDLDVPTMVGDSGSGGTRGLVPAPGAGDAAAGKFLKADGTFAVPPSGSSAPTPVENEVVAFTGTAGTLANTPSATAGYTQVKLYRDGQRLNPGAGNDFTWSGTAVTLASASSGSVFIADYYK
jgi:hypothetical protein